MVVVAIAARYKGYRYPIEVIGHAVGLYHRFALSWRDVEELMLARGVVVSYETIRSWCAKFGPDYAAQELRRISCVEIRVSERRRLLCCVVGWEILSKPVDGGVSGDLRFV